MPNADAKDAETDFYMYAKLAGIEQVDSGTFTFGGKQYRAKVTTNEAANRALGGKVRAFKMLRYADLVRHFSAQPGGETIPGIVGASFDKLSQHYPLLRSYYEATMLNATFHTWLRW